VAKKLKNKTDGESEDEVWHNAQKYSKGVLSRKRTLEEVKKDD
jgi:hypothetical protein